MERTYIASVRQFINATAAGDTVRFTIDMRNMFPQARNVRSRPRPRPAPSARVSPAQRVRICLRAHTSRMY